MKIATVEVFLAVARHGSVAAAARALGRHRTTLSMALAALEEELDAVLFERSGNRLRLTATGHSLLDDAQRLVTAQRRMVQACAAARSAAPAVMRLGRDDVLPERFWRQLLKDIRRQRPRVRIQMLFASPEVLIRRVAEGQLDAAYFMAQRAARPEPGLELEVINRVQLEMRAASGHPLAQLPRVSAEDLALYPQLTYLDSANRERFYLTGVGDDRIALSSFELVRDGILDHLGWGYVPVTLLQAEHGPRLARLAHGMNRLYASFYACRREGTPAHAGCHALVVERVCQALEAADARAWTPGVD